MRDFLESVRRALAAAIKAPPEPERGQRRSAGPEYAIAGSFGEFMIWRSADRKGRSRVIYLATAERAEQVARTGAPGLLHRIGSWEMSPAKEAAQLLEHVE